MDADFQALLKRKWYFQGFNGTPALLHGASRSMVYDMPKLLGYGYTAYIGFYEDDKAYFLYGIDDLHAILKELRSQVKKDPKYLNYLLTQDAKLCKTVLGRYKKVAAVDWIKASPAKLFQLWRTVNDAYGYLLSVSHIVEGFVLTTEDTIRNKVRKHFPNNSEEVLKVLTAPLWHSFLSIEHNELYKIVHTTQKCKLIHLDQATLKKYPLLKRALEKHQKKYFWKLNGYTSSKILSVEDFMHEVNDLLAKKVDVAAKIKEFNSQRENKQRKQKILKTIHDPELKELIAINDVIFKIHDRRKEHMTISLHYLDGLLNEIGKRFNVPVELMRYIQENEFEQLPHIKDTLAQRRKKSVTIMLPTKKIVLTGKEAEDYITALNAQRQTEQSTVVKGNCASRGRVVGIVKVCRGEKELVKVQQGDILVACMTQPEFVPAMKKAAAVITDEGGLTCHAAIITRELGIPCVIGTKVGTQILKDGMKVEVDADKGVVRILSK